MARRPAHLDRPPCALFGMGRIPPPACDGCARHPETQRSLPPGDSVMNRTKPVTAKDLMNKDVVRLDADAPIESAIEMLDENEISGAPVTDGSGHLLGVLSARDV